MGGQNKSDRFTVDKVNYYEINANINILITQARFVMEFSPYTLKITQITILFEIFSNLQYIVKNTRS